MNCVSHQFLFITFEKTNYILQSHNCKRYSMIKNTSADHCPLQYSDKLVKYCKDISLKDSFALFCIY